MANTANEERFTFETEVHGEGGFAKAYRGRDRVLERNIAAKLFNPLVTEFSDAEQERFRREARILASLSHPNIPAIYDVEFGSNSFRIVFQFIEGANLRRLVEEEGAVDIVKARDWFRQIASALDHAHGLKIIHRDVKPDNIIITPDGESAYLVDFGIALSAEDAEKLTQSGWVMGTLGYMSPEQQAGENIDGRSAIYSLGVTLYETLAGKPIPQGQYEELAIMNEAIPSQLDDLVQDCLEPKEHRLGSVREFSSRLAGALRPLKPLSEVLAHGRLHEIALAVEELTAEEFMTLPEGQRVLILEKFSDVVGSGESQLQFASIQFLELLLTRGLLLEKESYGEIVAPAIDWGFECTFGERVGRRSLRDVLEQAAYQARADAHEVLREKFGSFLSNVNLEEKEDWFLNGSREVLQTLSANPSCTSGAGELAEALRAINNAQRQKR